MVLRNKYVFRIAEGFIITFLQERYNTLYHQNHIKHSPDWIPLLQIEARIQEEEEKKRELEKKRQEGEVGINEIIT